MAESTLDFFKFKEKAKTVENIEQLSEVLYPCVEHLLDDMIRSYAMDNFVYKKQREDSYVDFTAALTLLFASTQYLNKLTRKKNEFGINRDTIKEISHRLLDSLLENDKNKAYTRILKDTFNAT